jgi:hypothetical protein
MARVKFLWPFGGRAVAWRSGCGNRRDSGCIFINARDAMAMAVTAQRFVFVALLSGQPACLVPLTFTFKGLDLQTHHELLVPPLLRAPINNGEVINIDVADAFAFLLSQILLCGKAVAFPKRMHYAGIRRAAYTDFNSSGSAPNTSRSGLFVIQSRHFPL